MAALVKAIDRIDEVIALIRGSASAAEAQQGLMGLLDIDEIQARAILDMQLRKLAALERQELIDERDELDGQDRRLRVHPGLAQPAADDRRHELAEIVSSTGTSGGPRSSPTTARWPTRT